VADRGNYQELKSKDPLPGNTPHGSSIVTTFVVQPVSSSSGMHPGLSHKEKGQWMGGVSCEIIGIGGTALEPSHQQHA
jgi:hypothetical protein